MPEPQHHFENRTRDAVLAFNRLVRIGAGANIDDLRAIPAPRQLLLEQLRRIDLVEELGLEIQAGGQIQVGVRRARVAVDAAVFAAALGVDGLIERNVR